MGTTAHVAVLGGDRGLVHQAAARIADLERRWSRFTPDSELSRLNAGPGDVATIVSPDTYRLVERSVGAWHLTNGRYDPTVLSAVIANGYDRTFSSIPSDRHVSTPRPQRAPGCGEIGLDSRIHAITLPAGVGIDPGGIGKGLAADMVAEELMARGAHGVLVDIGGDIRVCGTGPHDGSWVIDVNHPLHPERTLLHLALTDAGVATSSRLQRRWDLNGISHHHLIDPATGGPTTTPLVAATVIAGEAWWAEALTKMLFVTGDLDTVPNASAMTVDDTGRCRATDDLMGMLV